MPSSFSPYPASSMKSNEWWMRIARERSHMNGTHAFSEPTIRAFEQRRDVERRGVADRQRAGEVVHREPGVDDRVDEEHVAALDFRVEILQEADAVVVLAVSGELDEVERVVNRGRAREVADERDARLQRPHEQRLAARVLLRDLGTDLAHAGADLLRVEEHLADAVVVCRGPAQDAFWSPNRAASRMKSRS